VFLPFAYKLTFLIPGPRLWNVIIFLLIGLFIVDHSCRAVRGEGLRPRGCWDYGFESLRERRCLSLVIVVRCQRSLRRTDPSFFWSPTDCGVLLSVMWKPQEWGGLVPRWAAVPETKKKAYLFRIQQELLTVHRPVPSSYISCTVAL
jgi:hypothetical protein